MYGEAIGIIQHDPEIKEGAKCGRFCKFCVYDKTDRKKGDTKSGVFVNISAFGNLAEFAESWLKKGTGVIVRGSINARAYAGRDGEQKASVDMVANSIKFLPREQEREESFAALDAVQVPF